MKDEQKRAIGAWLHGLTAEDREDVMAAIRRLTNERRAVQRRETDRGRRAHPASAQREAHGAVASHAATGCPSCGQLGIPGMPCARCVEAAHGEAVRRAMHVLPYGLDDAERAALVRHHEGCRAAWVGANVLLDELGLLLLRVGLELPAVDVGARGTR